MVGMKAKSVLTIFLLCVLCTGAVCAWAGNTDVEVSPSGDLHPGEHVSAVVSIGIPGDSCIYRINMYSELADPAWSATLVNAKDGTSITEFYGKDYIDGFSLSNLRQDTSLTIYVYGWVPYRVDAKTGKPVHTITVMTVEEITSSGIVVSECHSAPQKIVRSKK